MGDNAFLIPILATLIPAAGGFIAMTMITARAALIASVSTFALQAALLVATVFRIDGSGPSWLVLEPADSLNWFPQWGITYDVSVDPPTLGLLSLTAVVTLCASIFAHCANRERPAPFQGLLWLTAAAVSGMFVARDLVVFYVYFELMLIPLLFLVGGWGGAERVKAAVTMFVYTLVGSLPMLVGVIAVGVAGGTFSIERLSQYAAEGNLDVPWWAFASFLLAFAIKAPLLPFHGWLPLAYREAPAEVTAVLSGLISKAAAFGFLLVLLPLFPGYIDGGWGVGIVWWSIASLLYGSLCAFRQPDARGVVAYSSLAQMGLIFLGFAVVFGDGGAQGLGGAYMQTINHGLISAALFLIVGMVELRTGTGVLARLGGLASGRPVFATTVLVVSLCALAVPGSNAFAGELLVLAATFQADASLAWLYAALGGVAIVLAALYALRLLSALLHSPGDGEDGSASAAFGGDMNVPEFVFVAPLLAGIVLLSVWPNVLHRAMSEPPVAFALTAGGPAESVPRQDSAEAGSDHAEDGS